ncbi:protein kinase domain-containing protein [Allorhodopirellula solitaria]|uniref:Serine/threonine-protein kinase PknL n=1 Tax=Allorhodopirellula solitaria TaxID=2527987 RepID=A0A5C5X8M0_9BACT|nr:protein kinase [Allorhodopirellula solitaria]TWT59280.1 Serine/threonine-protein kinase PknL [Allorhodopirellula solitaria]
MSNPSSPSPPDDLNGNLDDRSIEHTQAQGSLDQAAARRRSMMPTMPPAEVPGVRVERFLGAGAFGQVWVGKNLNTGRGVAVKFYLHRGGVNWSLLSREVKNLVQLSGDRHVVQVLEVGWDADPPYYVMELVAGGSLEDLLRRRGRLPLSEAVGLFQKICVGLNHCHSKGVLHCDIKPANILIADDNEPRLADFGQSRMSHDQTPAMGTLFYMAPEQADFHSTPNSGWDVYAAGALLYRMLSGNAPHRDQSLLSQLDTAGSLPGRLARYREAISAAPPAVDSLSRRDIDRPLRRILQKCLNVEPNQRYSNMQQVIDDLQRREVKQQQRPMMLLGIAGPLLLLIATCAYAYRGINGATETATTALRREAFGSNQLAARFAAQTLETEIEHYFHLAEAEATRVEFNDLLRDTLADREVESALNELGTSKSPRAALSKTAARDTLLDNPTRLRLNDYLQQRLQSHTSDTGLSGERQPLDSLFVIDSSGTTFASAFGGSVPRNKNSAGRNFAFRTYFHGGQDELPATVSLDQVDPLEATHLSSAFQSTSTGLWKVAISAPIDLHPDDEDQRVDAIFVATINVGDFELLRENDVAPNHPRRSGSQVAVLVEARQGPLRGTVLQHPLMDQHRRTGESLSDSRFQVDSDLVDQLLEGGDVGYRDPMAQAPGGKAYAGEWIAAMQPVTLPRPLSSEEDEEPGVDRSGSGVAGVAQRESTSRGASSSNGAQKRPTDLLVLVQYRLSDVLGPVGELRRSLFREGLTTIASILLVTFILWWVVRRSGDDEGTTTPHPVEPSDSTAEPGETMPVN